MYRNSSKQYYLEQATRKMKTVFTYWNKKTKEYQYTARHYRKGLMMRLGLLNLSVFRII